MTATWCDSDTEVAALPARFRFSDVNPLTLRSYAQSQFDDLPGYAADVVQDVVGCAPREWDSLVCAGEAYSVAGYRRWFSITSWLRAQVKIRKGKPGRSMCSDCWGTCVAVDGDGSLTGKAGAAMVCPCASSSLRTPVPAPHRSTTAGGRTFTFHPDGVNPLNGKPYKQSLWRELPGPACDLLSDMYCYTSSSWDREVAMRAAEAVAA